MKGIEISSLSTRTTYARARMVIMEIFKMVKIGVLALQGAVSEHIRSVEASGAEAVVVKSIEQLRRSRWLNLTRRRKYSNANV